MVVILPITEEGWIQKLLQEANSTLNVVYVCFCEIRHGLWMIYSQVCGHQYTICMEFRLWSQPLVTIVDLRKPLCHRRGNCCVSNDKWSIWSTKVAKEQPLRQLHGGFLNLMVLSDYLFLFSLRIWNVIGISIL